ncbi:hypothetical protein [Streptomyces carpaticus]|uniref:APAF-1 helical domain-containing protein n=1 Tax=Streptomyces carpaticus TaxID=285558 RepID=A0ABV4ZIQ6_9ACTN
MQGEQGQTGNDFSGRARDVVQAHTVHVHGSPPAAAPSPPPRMAPAAPTRFVLREALGRTITDALRPDALVLLAGGGGYGKTAMAGWAARAFTGGVLWAELGQRPGLERIVASLAELTAALTGSRTQTYADVHAAAGAFRTALAAAENRTLLVVDDAWNADDVRPFLVGEGLTVLVTTRRPGLLDGTEIAVDAMSDDEAVAMLGRGSSTELRPLLDRVGRWPLALAMLRGLINMDGMTVEEAVTAVLDELDGAGPAALDDLHDPRVERGIARTLELSLMDLPDDASRDHYISLAAFPEGEMIPYWLLSRLWNLSPLRTRNEARRFVSRSLAQLPHPDGLQMHDLPRETLRRADPARMTAVSGRLLDALRPADGWHALPQRERGFLHGLAYHLHQAERWEEFGALLRDTRFLATRLSEGGPTALEADLTLYASARPEDDHARELGNFVRQEGHLFTSGGLSVTDVTVTLATRLLGRPLALEHADQDLPLRAEHPLPDRDDGMLLRSVSVRGTGGSVQAMDLHPTLPLLATVGAEPALEIYDTDTWKSVYAWPGHDWTLIEAVRWSPDGRRLALVEEADGFVTPASSREEIPDDDAGAAHEAYTVSVLDTTTWQKIDVLTVPERPWGAGVPATSWSPDSRSLAVTWGRREIRLWTPGTGTTPEELTAPAVEPSGPYDALDWHPDHGLTAHATGSEAGDGTLVHWADPRTPDLPTLFRHPDLTGHVDALSRRPGGASIALACDGFCMVLLPSNGSGTRWPRRSHSRTCLRWSPSGEELVTADRLSGDTQLQRWAIPQDGAIQHGRSAEPASEPVSVGRGELPQEAVVWRPDGTLITRQDDATLKLWALDSAGAARRPAPRTALQQVMWAPGGAEVAVLAHQDGWYLMDPAQPGRGLLRRVEPHPYTRRDPTQRDAFLREIGELGPEEFSLGLTLVAFAPDERTYAVASGRRGPLRLVSPGEAERQARLAEDHPLWTGLCFAPSGDRLIGSLRLHGKTMLTAWEFTADRSDQLVPVWAGGSPTGVSPPIESVACLTAGDTHLALIAASGLIGLFSLHDLQPICWLRTNAPLRHAAFSPSGGHLAVAGDAGLHLFSVAPLPPVART